MTTHFTDREKCWKMNYNSFVVFFFHFQWVFFSIEHSDSQRESSDIEMTPKTTFGTMDRYIYTRGTFCPYSERFITTTNEKEFFLLTFHFTCRRRYSSLSSAWFVFVTVNTREKPQLWCTFSICSIQVQRMLPNLKQYPTCVCVREAYIQNSIFKQNMTCTGPLTHNTRILSCMWVYWILKT